jgi:hypothetical protein
VFTARCGLDLELHFRLDPVFKGTRHNSKESLNLNSSPNVKIRGKYWRDVRSVWPWKEGRHAAGQKTAYTADVSSATP